MIINLIHLWFGVLVGLTSGQKYSVTDTACGRGSLNESTSYTKPTPIGLGTAPWHVMIFYVQFLPEEKWQLLCSGSIIAKDIVLTAASCVYYEKLLDATDFKVVASLTREAFDKDDVKFIQPREVKQIILHKDYRGEIAGYSENLAILYIDPPFDLGAYVQPVCIDWKHQSSTMSLPHMYEMSSMGIGNNKVSFQDTFPISTNSECRKANKQNSIRRYITYDKFCVTVPEGRGAIDSGNGLVTKIGDRYYLMGIMSYDIGYPDMATNITKFHEWLNFTIAHTRAQENCQNGFLCNDLTCIGANKECNGALDCPDQSDEEEELCRFFETNENQNNLRGCKLPIHPGVSYLRVGCVPKNQSCYEFPGSRVPDNRMVYMTCGRGSAPAVKDPRYVCYRGEWFQEEPRCVKLCPPRVKPNVAVTCTLNNVKVNCTDYMSSGTVATTKCEQFYKYKDSLYVSERSKCEKGGTWTTDLPTCQPECGIANEPEAFTTRISDGTDTPYGKYPWHVALYHKEALEWVYKCGGSIITPRLILTAAHCVHYDGVGKMDAHLLQVAAGKFKIEFDPPELHQQSRLVCMISLPITALSSGQVNEVILPDSYVGKQTQYEHDIGVLDLIKPLTMTMYVKPCCMDFSKDFTEKTPPNLKVTVVGWGSLKYAPNGLKGVVSPTLLETEISVKTASDCRQIDDKFLSSVTADKFCGIHINGSGPQGGDSGGGIVKSYCGIYYLIGIVSVQSTTSPNVNGLTSVAKHREWLVEVLLSHRDY